MSFNSLFGLGGNSEDANLEGFWPLQDDAASTAVDDVSSNNRNGTAAANTSTKSTTGPNSWLAKALDFNGSSDAVNIGTLVADAIETEDAFTLGAWCNPDNFTSDGAIIGNRNSTGSTQQYMLWVDVDGTGDGLASRIEPSGNIGDNDANLTATAWQLCYAVWDGTTHSTYVDGTLGATQTAAVAFPASANDWYLGWANETGIRYLDGKLSGAFAFSRSLSGSEQTEVRLGPEPVNTVAPVLSGTETEGQTLSCTTGTWGLPSPFSAGSNGTVTYTYQWTRSNDSGGTGEADISGATSSTYTLQAADVGKFIRCRVRGTNDGGFDAIQDTDSNMSGAIIASGGGGFQAAWARGSNVLIGV